MSLLNVVFISIETTFVEFVTEIMWLRGEEIPVQHIWKVTGIIPRQS